MGNNTSGLLAKGYSRIAVSDQVNEESVSKLKEAIATLSERLEKADLAEFVQYYRRPGRVLYVNFIGGLARGLGIAIGATLLLALVLYILTLVVNLNLPVISRAIAEVVNLVQRNLEALETLR